MVLYRTAYAYHMMGSGALAKERLAELKDKSGDAIGRVGGQDVKLVDNLTSLLATKVAVAKVGSAAGSYPMMGGNDSRSLVPSGACNPGARFYSVELTKAALGPPCSDVAQTSTPPDIIRAILM
jgi:hypothetical protein